MWFKMAGVILQDWDNPASLEQVSKLNSTNQNMCSDVGTYHGVFSYSALLNVEVDYHWRGQASDEDDLTEAHNRISRMVIGKK